MPVVKLNAFFKDDDGEGWSEQHEKDGGSSITSLTTFLNGFHSLMQSFRRPLLGGDAFYLGCRASYKTDTGAIAGDNIFLDPPMRGPQTFGGATVNLPKTSDAVKQRMRNDASTARSDIYLRGIWKDVINAGVLDFGVNAQAGEWKRRLDIYTGQLVQLGYGWVGINPALTSRGRVTGYVSNPTGTVTLNLTQVTGGPIPAAGTKVTCSFAKINASKSILNRSFTCVVDVGAAAVTTTEKVAVSAFETEGTYIIQVKGLIPYAAASYVKLSSRKTGKPFGLERGRGPVKVLH